MKFFSLISLALLTAQAWAFHGAEFKTADPGFHKRRTSKLASTSGYKLPGNARPHSYEVTLTIGPDPYSNYIISGEVLIKLDVDPSGTENHTDTLQLNAALNYLNGNPTILWNEKDSCDLTGIGSEYMEFRCPESIEGTDQTVRITYEVNFSGADEYGVYELTYTEDGVIKYMIATQLEQDYARRLFPCFDEPEYKAPIQLTLKTDRANNAYSQVMSNMAVAKESIDGTVVTTTFEQTPSMSAYLLAFVITNDFKNFTDANVKTDGYTFEIFARPSAEKYLSIALENGPKLIDLMGGFTGITYPMLGNSRMVLATVPEFFAGGMENWGLILIREQILIDEGKERTTARDLQFMIEVIAHELAHQWFGDYVTLDWWSEAWLNEGFAEYFQYYLSSQLSPDFDNLRQFVVKEKQQALKADAYPSAIPLSNNDSQVTTNTDLWAEFGDITYLKGASIIRLLSYTLGEENFKKGLQTYLTNNKFSNPTAAILIDTLQTMVPDKSLDLKKLYNDWIYENGYPLLTVSVDDKNMVTIEATRFSSSLNKTGENNDSIWWIPLTYTTSEAPNFKDISFDWKHSSELSKLSVELPEGDSWIIFNLQSIGYFRVNYDQTLWDRIINVLNNSKTYTTIDVLNRAQLLDDIFNIAKSYQTDQENGNLYYLTAFKLAEYLKYETEYHPWYTFFTEMQYLMEVIQDETTLASLKEKILDVIAPQLVIPKDSETLSHTEKLRKNLLLTWACKLGHEKCVQWAKDSFKKYKEDPTSIDNNYRDVIVCTGLANSVDSKNDFDQILSNMKSSILPLEQNDLVKALTSINKDDLVEELLEETVDYIPEEPNFSKLYNDKILAALYTGGSRKISCALKFVLNYDNSIQQYWDRIDTAEAVFKKIASKIYSQEHIDMFNKYIKANSESNSYKSRIAAAKEAITIAQENIKYLNTYSDVLRSVLVHDKQPTASANHTSFNITLAIVLSLILKYMR